MLQSESSLHTGSFLALNIPYIGGTDDLAAGLVNYSGNFFYYPGVCYLRVHGYFFKDF